jgi:hypothetical protein
MIDELELLKKDWQKKEGQHPKLTYDEIYRMLWKKSSSIVKWILIISILEFALPHLLYLLPSTRDSFTFYEQLGVKNLVLVLTFVQYAVVLYFIFQFYRRYREISVLDNAKELMSKIIETRSIVKNYILFSLAMILLLFFVVVVGIYLNDEIGTTFAGLIEKSQNISPEKLKKVLMWSFAITGIVFTAFLGGIYFLLYGRLLRKLKKNYVDLKQLDL